MIKFCKGDCVVIDLKAYHSQFPWDTHNLVKAYGPDQIYEVTSHNSIHSDISVIPSTMGYNNQNWVAEFFKLYIPDFKALSESDRDEAIKLLSI